MCGIVGYVGPRPALEVLLDGLKRLEYRGYDSSGVVLLNDKKLHVERAPGKLSALAARLKVRPLAGSTGLGHTRWATHGGVNESNAHPHRSCDGRIAVVHNGIVENYQELRRDLKHHTFTSATDTEVLAHLIEQAYEKLKGQHPLKAVTQALEKVRGSFALGVIYADHPDLLIAARVNCPLVLGIGQGENFLASDLSAVLNYTRRILPLEENEVAKIDPSGVQIFDRKLGKVRRRPMEVAWKAETALKSGYPHYMLKEIHEQQQTVAAEITGRGEALDDVRLPRDVDRIVIVACGTAWHAGLVGKVAIEETAQVPVEVGMASELRYGDHPFGPRVLTIAVSQSGETADTLAAVRNAREAGSKVIAITNVKGSTLAREAGQTLFMRAGLEIGVAATKTYTSQVMNLLFLAAHLGRRRGTLPAARFQEILREARRLPGLVERVLENTAEIRKCARKFSRGYDFMYIGRRYNLATAYEGALKMKEISYLHAEGYGAGEMKHGPLALVDDRMTCVAIAPTGRVTEKMVSNIQEIRARRGRVISVATAGDRLIRSVSEHVFEIPACDEMFSPVLAVIPLQLLAYYTATALGRDVDQPRNLAKSVTVE
ncbi:MAG TPA: glutamine--fructose-6-phosphate transaminase (isomerizing) [Planctomycetota bacterium]|nr:glutamine--fructose-6-phosphate transaminase (isomerizing) [Planctomycetota bacterium]